MSENATRFAAEFAAKSVTENAPEKVTEFVAESVRNTRQNLLGINYRNFIICTDNFPIPSR